VLRKTRNPASVASISKAILENYGALVG